jgi:hypothetical protein
MYIDPIYIVQPCVFIASDKEIRGNITTSFVLACTTINKLSTISQLTPQTNAPMEHAHIFKYQHKPE